MSDKAQRGFCLLNINLNFNIFLQNNGQNVWWLQGFLYLCTKYKSLILMQKSIFLTALAGVALLSACSRPVPVAQDGTDLWLAAGRPYADVLASVETTIDPALPAEGYHIYDADGQRHVAAGSEAGLRYGVYALQRAEVLGAAGPGSAHPPLRRALRIRRHQRRGPE